LVRRLTAPAPAVILGGGGTAVPVARSLAAAGVPVAALGVEPWDPVRFSRAGARYFCPPAGHDVQESWLWWLKRDAPNGGVLIPCSDDGLDLVARHAGRLRSLGYVTTGAPELTSAMLDKAQTYRLAREAGIPTPRTAVVDEAEEPDAEALGVSYPCALKPVVSHRFARHFPVKAFVVEDADALRAVHRLTAARGVRMMLTEIIPGDDDRLVSYVSHLDAGGEPLVQFTHRKLRQWPNGFGLACLAVSGWEPEVAEAALAFLRHVGHRGVSHVEFKRDPRDGAWKLIECNQRFTIEIVGTAPDLPLLVYRQALGIAGAPVPEVNLGRRLWNPVADVRSMRSLRRRGELRTIDWVRSLRGPVDAHVFSRDDPLPTVGYHAGVALEYVRRRAAHRHRADPDRSGRSTPTPPRPELVEPPLSPAPPEALSA
jgi:predicted ATP-grasp superfamily ATP-dependent carboligase